MSSSDVAEYSDLRFVNFFLRLNFYDLQLERCWKESLVARIHLRLCIGVEEWIYNKHQLCLKLVSHQTNWVGQMSPDNRFTLSAFRLAVCDVVVTQRRTVLRCEEMQCKQRRNQESNMAKIMLIDDEQTHKTVNVL